MCGLFGALSTNFLSQNEKDNLHQLAVMAQLRGIDSTGVVAVHKKTNKKYSHKIVKRVGDSTAFMNDPQVKRTLDLPQTFVVAGHTRKATCGEVNEKNAHPIHVGKIIGLHNGVINNFAPVDEDDDTDSRVLIQKINQKGIKDALQDVGTGAYALVYVDCEKLTINFIRNVQRPLHYMWDSAHQTMYWASEIAMLRLLREREGESQFNVPMIFQFDTLYSIKLGTLDVKKEEIKRTFVRAPEIHPLMVPPFTPDKQVTIVYCRKCHKRKEYCYCDQYPKTSVPVVNNKDLGKVLYRGWERKHVPATDVIDVLVHGCSTCRSKQTIYSDVMWVAPHTVICDTCLGDRQIYGYIRDSFERMFPGSLIEGSYVQRKLN
jgi:asparagine synthetase B (glutamine-hydrolysing)